MFSELESDRFLLQKILPEDQAFVFEALSDPEVIPYYGVSYDTYEAAEAQMQFYNDLTENGTGGWWKIVDRHSHEKLGAIGYNNYQPKHNRAEIGYWLLTSSWKRGIASEVLPIIVEYLRTEIELHRIEALIEEGNNASIRLLEKTGFLYEGTLRECEVKNGKYISLRVYSLITDA